MSHGYVWFTRCQADYKHYTCRIILIPTKDFLMPYVESSRKCKQLTVYEYKHE